MAILVRFSVSEQIELMDALLLQVQHLQTQVLLCEASVGSDALELLKVQFSSSLASTKLLLSKVSI